MKKLIANWIVRSNQWYEDLPEKRGRMFYNGLIFIPYVFIVFGIILLYPGSTGIFGSSMGLVWILLVCIWRLSFDWIKTTRKRKEV